MASSRAQAVAELLWELKKWDKVARFSAIADKAGFKAGVNGKAMHTCLKSVRREWPHLEDWRAIPDDGTLEPQSQQVHNLKAWGATLSEAKADRIEVAVEPERLMTWEVIKDAVQGTEQKAEADDEDASETEQDQE